MNQAGPRQGATDRHDSRKERVLGEGGPVSLVQKDMEYLVECDLKKMGLKFLFESIKTGASSYFKR